jgi:hypothetical protein
LRAKILALLHSLAIGRHSGIKATYQRIRRIFHWPNLRKSVEDFASQCAVYQRAKSEHCHYPGLLAPLPIPNLAWCFISMDFVEGLPKSRNKSVILVVVGKLTKYAHFLSLSHPFTAATVVQLFIDNIFKLHGPHIAIVTDRDMLFTSKLCQDIFKSMRVSLHYSSAYQPQTNEQTERVNQCLESYLGCMAFLEQKNGCPRFHWLNGCTTPTTTPL